MPSIKQVIAIDQAGEKHIAETISDVEYDDMGSFGCESVAREFCELNDIAYKSWKIQNVSRTAVPA